MSNQTLAQKLLAVQRKLGPLTKDADNPFHKSKYADLTQVYELAKPELNALDVLIAHAQGKDALGAYMETSLVDTSTNQAMNAKVYYSGNEDNMQKIGAAGTYAKRQGLKALLAMEEIDDDGNEASGVGRGQGNQGKREVDAKEPRQTRAPASGTAVGAGVGTVGGVRGESKAPVPAGAFNRKNCNEKISLTSKVLIDSKRATQEEVLSMLKMYNVDSKEKLNDDQAKKLLSQLEEKLNAK